MKRDLPTKYRQARPHGRRLWPLRHGSKRQRPWAFAVLVGSIIAASLPASFVHAEGTLLSDHNGDGSVAIVAFGDSITFGLGDDGIPLQDESDSISGAFAAARIGKGGYPQRLSTLLNIFVDNDGAPGEELLVSGAQRVPSVLLSSTADIITILEGTNDAVHQASTSAIRFALQKSVNAARVLGKLPVLMTLPGPSGAHEALQPYTMSYSAAIRELAALNEVPLVDLERTWRTTCAQASACELYNLPEGLHPKALGYDAIAQTVAATLLGIDIFAVDGATNLESALALPAGTIIVKPGL